MKKLLFLPILILSIIALASCGGETDYTYHKPYEGKEVYTNYLSQIEFEDKFIYDGKEEDYNKKAARFEVYLPKNILGSTRYVVDNIEAIYETRYEKVTISARAYSDFSTTSGVLLNAVNSRRTNLIAEYNKEVEAIKGFNLTENYQVPWDIVFNNDILAKFEKQEGKQRAIVTAYFPVKVDYFTPKDDSDAVKTLTTFAILPIYSALEYVDKDNKISTLSLFSKFEKVDLTLTDAGLLN